MIPLPPSRTMGSPIRSLSSRIVVSKAGKPLARSETVSTSINHINGQSNRPSSSVFHAGQTGRNVTSIKRLEAVSHSVNGEAAPEEYGTSDQQDDSYYAYARRLVKERLKREAEAKVSSPSAPLAVGTGQSFRAKIFQKKLSKFFRTKRTSFGSMTSAQKKAFGEIVTDHAKHKTTPGTGFSYHDVKTMKRELYKKKHQLGLSTAQTKRLQNLVSTMKRPTK